MATSRRHVRQSISLPRPVVSKVRALAKSRRTSANRVLVNLVEAGLESESAEKQRFFELADQLASSKDPKQRKRLKKELARLTFGE